MSQTRRIGRRYAAAVLAMVGVLAMTSTALAQLSDDARTSTRGTQFVRPAPRPQPPPAQPEQKPPEPPPAPTPAPAAVEPPKPPPPKPKPPARYPSVVFLVDTSDSMLNRISPGAERTRLDDAKDALTQVLSKMAPDTRVQVWSFNTKLTPVLVPGVRQGQFVQIGQAQHRSRLIEQVKQLKTKGGTNLYQSVVQALDLFGHPRDQAAYRSGDRFPVLVVLSDGEDGGKTRHTLKSVQEAKQKYELVTVNTVGFRLSGNASWFEVLCKIASRKSGCATADDDVQLRQMLDSFYRFRSAAS